MASYLSAIPDEAWFFIVPAFFFLAGLAVAVATLVWMKRAGSPFVKIAADAVDVFAADPHLRLVPVLVAGACVLAAAVASQVFLEFHVSLAGLAHLPRREQMASLDLVLMISCVVGAQFAGLAIAAANAVLADAFIERCHGRPAEPTSSMGRVLRRLPRLLAFTFLWWGLLSLIVIVKLHLKGLVRGVAGDSPWLEVAVDFAGFALETGLVMAAYLMLVVMLREDIGPLEAMSRTLQIVAREYGETLGELARLKALDESFTVMIYAACFAGQALALFACSPLYSQGIISIQEFTAFILLLTMAPGFLVGVGYYTIIQTLQLLLACAVFLFVHDGIMADGFTREDFENVLCLKAGSLPAGVTGGPSRPAQ